MPRPVKASRTSSSLNGLKMAMIIFISAALQKAEHPPRPFEELAASCVPRSFSYCLNGLAPALGGQSMTQFVGICGGCLAQDGLPARFWVVHNLHNQRGKRG